MQAAEQARIQKNKTNKKPSTVISRQEHDDIVKNLNAEIRRLHRQNVDLMAQIATPQAGSGFARNFTSPATQSYGSAEVSELKANFNSLQSEMARLHAQHKALHTAASKVAFEASPQMIEQLRGLLIGMIAEPPIHFETEKYN